MKIQEVETIEDLRKWVSENMPGALVEEGEEIVIRTGLISTMGGYLHKGGEE
jgi:hypothetical protein